MLKTIDFLTLAAFGAIGFLLGASLKYTPPIYHIFTFIPGDDFGVNFNGFDASVLLYYLGQYALTAFWGMGFIKDMPFFKSQKEKFVLWLASFLIGYVSLVGLVRIVSFFVPYAAIFQPVFLIQSISLMFMWQRELKDIFTGNWQCAWRPSRFFTLTALSVAVISLILLHQVRQGEFGWNGHGPTQYTYLLDEWQHKQWPHFPLITQHYDELIFHYYLSSPLKATFNPIIPWWLTLGCNKISMAALLFFLFQAFGVSRPFSGLGAMFLMIGTPSLNPFKYYTLFDSSNFFFFTVHSGRVAGFACLLLFLRISTGAAEYFSNRMIPFIILAAIGLTATPITNSLWTLLICAAGVLWHGHFTHANTKAPLEKHLLLNSWIIVWFSFAATLLMYALPFDHGWALRTRMVMAIALLVLLFGRFYLIRIPLPQLKPLIWIIAASLVGLLFFGNMLSKNPLSRTFFATAKTIGYDMPTITLPQSKGGSVIQLKPSCAIGDQRDFRNCNLYCLGIAPFVGYYGLILVFILLSQTLFSAARKNSDATANVLHEIFLLSVCCLPLLFFIIDFMDLGIQAWLKTRLLEMPVYLIIFIGINCISRFLSPILKIAAAVLLVIYSLGPFIMTGRLQQIFYNSKLLTELWPR